MIKRFLFALCLTICAASSAFATPARDGTAIHANASGGGVISLLISGVTITNNDVVVAIITAPANNIVTVVGSLNGNYTQLGVASGSSAVTYIYWVASTNTGMETITVTSTAVSFLDGIAQAYSGANTASPWDVLTGSSFVTNTVFHSSGPAMTTNGPNEMAIGGGIDGACGSSFTADASWAVWLAAMACTLAEDQSVVSSGGTATVNSTPHFTGSNIGAALKPAGAAAVVPTRTLLGVGQ